MLIYEIWIQIILPIIIGPIFIIFKQIYDRWDNTKRESIILKNKLKLEKVNSKLQDFYWPIYILLLKDFDLWSKIQIDDHETNITYSDSDSGLEQDENIYNYCIYARNENNKVIPCKNPVAYNCIDRAGPYCIKHQQYKNKKVLKVLNIMYNNSNTISSEKKDIIDYNTGSIDLELGNRENIKFINLVKKRIKYEKDNNSIGFDCNFNSSNIKDYEYNEEKSNSSIDSENLNNYDIDNDMKLNIIKLIKDNHLIISDIITKNISIAEPKKNVGKQLMKYIKFINILSSENTTNIINPADYGAPYPKKLLPIIEMELFKLQKKYNKVVEEYYKV